MWLDLYKKGVSSKGKASHVGFYNMLIEIIEDQEQKNNNKKDI